LWTQVSFSARLCCSTQPAPLLAFLMRQHSTKTDAWLWYVVRVHPDYIPLLIIYTCHKEIEDTDNFLRVFNINGNALIIVIVYSDGTVPWMVIRRPFTKETQVQSQGSPCAFCGGQNESVTSLCPNTLSVLVYIFSPMFHIHSSVNDVIGYSSSWQLTQRHSVNI
jgi:hypothetical protein